MTSLLPLASCVKMPKLVSPCFGENSTSIHAAEGPRLNAIKKENIPPPSTHVATIIVLILGGVF